MSKKDVSGKVKTDQTTVNDGDWYYRTKKLADADKGFWTDVSDRSVQPVRRSYQDVRAHDRREADCGSAVDWTWELGGGNTMVTTGYTDSNGKATSSYVIPGGFTHAQVYVYAHTSAYSVNRKSEDLVPARRLTRGRLGPRAGAESSGGRPAPRPLRPSPADAAACCRSRRR